MLRYLDKIITRARQFRPAPNEAVVEMKGGYKVRLRPNADRHERQLYFNRTYEPATLALFDRVLRPGDTMLDIGANLGLMTLHAAQLTGPSGMVIALEPHPDYFPRLSMHVAMNAFANVKLLQIAAGEFSQDCEIFDVPSINIGRSSLIRPKVASRQAGTVAVEPLDDILARLDVGPIRLMKIDVEGFEPKVLRGAPDVLKRQPVICMEVSAAVDSDGEQPLAAHDIIMSTGAFAAYCFQHGKGRASALAPIGKRESLARQKNDNVVYVPHSLRTSLPADLFVNQRRQ